MKTLTTHSPRPGCDARPVACAPGTVGSLLIVLAVLLTVLPRTSAADEFVLDLDVTSADALQEAGTSAVSPLSQHELAHRVEHQAAENGFLGWPEHYWAIALGISTFALLLLTAATRWVRIPGKARQLLRAHKILAYCTMGSAVLHASIVLFA